MSTLNQRLYVNVESTLYVSVFSSFKFKYIFNIISTYIVNVESTLNQQTRAHLVGKAPYKELILLCAFSSHVSCYMYMYKFMLSVF